MTDTIDVMLRMHVRKQDEDAVEFFSKRLAPSSSFEQLATKAVALASKHNVVLPESPIFWYPPGRVDVEDDEDLALAYASAAKTPTKQLILSFRAPSNYVVATDGSVINLSEVCPGALKKPAATDEEMNGDDEEVPAKGKKNKTKDSKLPRKALKNLIQQELTKSSREVFNTLLKSPTLDGALPESDKTAAEVAQDQVVHTNVECDGCGMNPIRGIRYKCSVRKNFDYCQLCEERLGHEHAFLKIKEAGGAPSIMINVLGEGDEEKKGEDGVPEIDLENLAGQFAQQFGGMPPFGGPHGRGAHRGGRGGMGRCGGRGGRFKQMVGEFLNNMGVPEENVKGMFNKCGGDKKEWKKKRAVIVKKPENTFEVVPGQCIITQVDVLNATRWPWKSGCVITLDDEQTETDIPIEFFSVPIEQEVKGMQTYTIEVPLVVRDHVIAQDKEQEIFLTFRGPKGNPFGQRIPLKIKVVLPEQALAQPTEADMCKLALKLFEAGHGSFEEVYQVVRKNNGDEASSLKELTSKDCAMQQ